MTVTLRIDLQQFGRVAHEIRAKYPASASRALKRSIDSAKTLMSRNVSRDLKLKVGDVKSRIFVRADREFDGQGRMTAQLRPSIKRIPLIKLGAKGSRSGGVTAKTPQGHYPRAFIATMPKSGHRGVFERVRPTRSRAGRPRSSPALPIDQLYGPSVSDVFAKHMPAGLARGEEQLRKNLASELKFLLRSVSSAA